MIISGAWLVHAAGRFENQFILMSLTVIHQLAAAAWIGGIFQLVNLWLLRHSKQVPAELWPLMLNRFSKFRHSLGCHDSDLGPAYCLAIHRLPGTV